MPHEPESLPSVRRPGRWRLAIAATLACLLTLAAGDSAQAGTARITATEENGYGRIVLQFEEDAPQTQVEIAGGVAVISFSEPVVIEADRMRAGLPSYVNVVRQDPDGRAVRLALIQPVSINRIAAAERVFIDFLPASWVGGPPGLPAEVIQELADRAREADRLAREAAARRQPDKVNIMADFVAMPTFGRYVFTPDKPIDMRLERDGAGATLTFDGPSAIDLGSLMIRHPDYVGDISRSVTKENSSLRFSIGPDVKLRDFRENESYIIDFVPPDGYRESGTVTIAGEDETAEAAAPSETPASETAAASAQAPAGEAAEAPRPAAPEAAREAETTEASASTPAAAEPAPGTLPEPATPAAAATATTASEVERAAAPVAPQAEQAAARDAADLDAPRISSERIGDGLRLTFSFAEPTPTAVFERMQVLWLVLDTRRAIDATALRNLPAEIVSGVENWQTGGATVFRLALAAPLLTTVDAEETRLSVVLGDHEAGSSTPLSLRRTAEGDAAAGEILLAGAGNLHEFTDPDTGGHMMVVTALGPARPVLKTQRFVDFTLWPTAHALALERVTDTLNVAVQKSLVRISRPRGLDLSAATNESLSMLSSEEEKAAARPAFVEIDPELTRSEAREKILEQIRQAAAASEITRNAERVALARTFVSLRLGAEALGMLEIAREDDRALEDDARARALRGMALVQMHRPQEALEAFQGFDLSQSTDAALWRGLAYGQLGQWAKALEAFATGRPALSSYSEAQQADILLTQAEAALELGQVPAAAGALDQAEDAGAGGLRRFQFLDGRLAEMSGDRNRAMAAYELVTNEGRFSDSLGAEAQLRKIMLGHAMGEFDDDEAIAQLESLTFGWRGDETEFTASAKLANLYAEKGEYRRAFELMRTATLAGPSSPAAAALQADMERVFEKLFLSAAGNDLPTVDALALYYDFKELTPIGRKGDEMIRALAERLISLDLLDQAADLLDYQIEHRLTGAARAQVATRLAAVHLMAKRPAKALSVLTDTRVAHLPAEIHNERILLEARALGEAGRDELALDLLTTVPVDQRTQRTRADILWAAERWQEAGEELERALGGRWEGEEKLSDAIRTDVLRAGIAYAMSGDRLGAQRLRNKFLDKMSSTRDAHAFNVVTQPAAAKEGEINEVVNRLGETDSLRAFMTEYSARLTPVSLPEG